MKFSEQLNNFIAHHEAANVQTVSLVFLKERVPEIADLEAEIAELREALYDACVSINHDGTLEGTIELDHENMIAFVIAGRGMTNAEEASDESQNAV